MSKEPGVIILDSRSDFRFDRIHIKGTKHLAFTDFTQDNLAKVIPTFETKILIYCNNNFDGNQTDFASKVALPHPTPDKAVSERGGLRGAFPVSHACNHRSGFPVDRGDPRFCAGPTMGLFVVLRSADRTRRAYGHLGHCA
jgi:hypothetical protein